MTPEAGVFLIAAPTLLDANFRRAVVLICEHGEEGSFGLIVNRPTDLHLAEVLVEPAGINNRLFLGGPVQPDTLHFLHAYNHSVHESVQVLDELAWGGSFEEAAEQLRQGRLDPNGFRFFAGYAGWGEGQLDGEIGEGSWITVPASADLVLHHPADRLWRDLIISIGGMTALMVNYPDDPQLN